MTRINLVPPATLTDEHLLAEYRELPRVFALAAAAYQRGPVSPPQRYTMGAGHVRFFFGRTDWLSARQQALIAELLFRGYQLAHTTAPLPLDVCPDRGWQPDTDDLAVNLARLRERIAKPGARYHHRRIPVGSDHYGGAP